MSIITKDFNFLYSKKRYFNDSKLQQRIKKVKKKLFTPDFKNEILQVVLKFRELTTRN